MFTGIIEAIGEVRQIIKENTNVTFEIGSPISHELKIDQSVSHNGVCLTVVKLTADSHFVTAIAETLQKTNLNNWQIGAKVNLERCMPSNGRFDGHVVQGHVDTVAKCTKVIDKKGSWEYTFQIEDVFAAMIVEKGSITLNGTSLTIFNVTENQFSVAIIPYTFDHTTIHTVSENDLVNIEFEIIGKYVQRILSFK